MTNWIHIDQKKMNEPIDSSGSGIDLQIFVSPYDIPEAMRGFYDDKLQRFVIELKYSSSEETLKKVQSDQHIEFHVGMDSSRLHRIVLDVDAIKADAVQLTIRSTQSPKLLEQASQAVEHAIDQLATQSNRYPRRGNYIAAKRAIKQNDDCLFKELVGADY